jgi:hypothetical protein
MNLLEGINKYYHSNGKIKAIGQVINGIKAGIWIFFDETGKFDYFKVERSIQTFPEWYLYNLTPMNNYSRYEMIKTLSDDPD